MNKVWPASTGCGNTDAVIDWAVWAALRLDAPLEFLHVLDRHPERSDTRDYSGAIGLGAQEALLQELSEHDAQRSRRCARRARPARRMRARARQRPACRGSTRGCATATSSTPCSRCRPAARLFVLGEHHHASGTAAAAPRPPARARDPRRRRAGAGRHHATLSKRRSASCSPSTAARRRVKALVAASPAPLLQGLPVLVAMIGADNAGVAATAETRAGAARRTRRRARRPNWPPATRSRRCRRWCEAQGAALLVMGAYGHSRLRQLLLGSTTTTLLRRADVPVLILR